MLFGEIIYRLQAVQTNWLIKDHGSLVHGAFFTALASAAPALAKQVHDEMEVKPFTVSLLMPETVKSKRGNRLLIEKASMAALRFTLFSEPLLEAMCALPKGYCFQLGKLMMRIEEQCVRTYEEEDLIRNCLVLTQVDMVCFDFTSPTSFHKQEDNYILPLPELIWGSLVDKWQKLHMEAPIDREMVRQAAENALLVKFSGHSERVYLRRSCGVNCFTGSFVFSLRHLAQDERDVLVVLAEFANFAGVGRMTGQGFGNVMVRLE